jgi:hypothetical protein
MKETDHRTGSNRNSPISVVEVLTLFRGPSDVRLHFDAHMLKKRAKNSFFPKNQAHQLIKLESSFSEFQETKDLTTPFDK